jgi:hypothetical protein
MGASTVAGSGVLIITNSTLTANTARGGDGSLTGSGGRAYGGAIFNLDGSVTLNSDTLVGNTLFGGGHGVGGSQGWAEGGAVYNLAFGNLIQTGGATSATLTLYNSILSNNPSNAIAFWDLASNIVNGRNTNTAAIAGSTNLVVARRLSPTTSLADGVITSTTYPNLGPLKDNGGPTWTMALTSRSSAYGAGNPSVPGLPDTDQRGVPRTVNGRLDLGAFELQNFELRKAPPSRVAALWTVPPPSPEPGSHWSPVQEQMRLAVDEVLRAIDPVVALAVTSVGILADPALAAAMDISRHVIRANSEDHTALGDAVLSARSKETIDLFPMDVGAMTSTRSSRGVSFAAPRWGLPSEPELLMSFDDHIR